jgi:ribonuclease-3
MKHLLLPFRKDYRRNRQYYRLLKNIFGIVPNNIELYKLALVHRSVSLHAGERGAPVNNERLEYLGDAVLEAIVSDFLFIEFPDKNEGFLTQIRSKIVSRVSLNEIAVRIGLDRHVIVQYNSNHIQKHLYGDALEAMIGAIYLDKGYNFVNRLVINHIIGKNLNLDKVSQVETDFKSRLIEWCQKHKLGLRFETLPAANHNGFVSRILIRRELLGTGTGPSKKEAEQQAAHESMSAIRKSKELRERLLAPPGPETPEPEPETKSDTEDDIA